MAIQHLGKIEHINIYFDSDHPDSHTIIMGRKSKGLEAGGIIWVDNKDLAMAEGVTIEKDEVDKILKEQIKLTKFEDYEFAVGSFSTLGPYQKAINLLKQEKNGGKANHKRRRLGNRRRR